MVEHSGWSWTSWTSWQGFPPNFSWNHIFFWVFVWRSLHSTKYMFGPKIWMGQLCFRSVVWLNFARMSRPLNERRRWLVWYGGVFINGYPKNGWSLGENSIRSDDFLGYPYFRKPPNEKVNRSDITDITKKKIGQFSLARTNPPWSSGIFLERNPTGTSNSLRVYTFFQMRIQHLEKFVC